MTEQMNVPKLRFGEFEGSWKTTKLGALTSKVGSGATPRGGEKAYSTSGIPFIRSQNVNYNRLLLNDIRYIPENTHASMKRSQIQPKDILLNITGASIGRSCVVPDCFQDGNLNQHVCIIRLKNDDPYFTQSLLASYRGEKLVFQGMAGGGREGLNFESIKGFKMAFPTLPEQQKIASFLSKVDEKIALLTEKKDKLAEYKKGVMQQLFNGKWQEQDGQLTFIPPTLRFKADDGSEFPDWEEKALGDFARIYDGTHQTPKYVDEGVPFYSVEHVTANQFEKTKYISEEVYAKECKRVTLKKGDILLTRIGSVGDVRLIDWDVRASFYVSLALVKYNDEIVGQYLASFMQSPNFQSELWKRMIHVAFPKKINLGEIGHCLVSVPSRDEQTKIANFLSAIDQKIDLANSELEKAKEWKRGLLQQMFV
ncbi:MULTISPECIES: restriction endonuclease subunit S [Vibrio]|uniref:restriction endonuclease subunit S n=1 Tax=Vibrio TaxID=662 RepID=UPI0001B95607|nr:MULTISPECIES: restriction endonuclease subunit S [Vibrio]EEX33766.1 type I restriction-modification system specificity subunit S [Vibrio coralliilyticus ATCC BAA-450]MDE3899221.1 restriction endonuclease subunit S [Vibrio sp. CC007]